MIEQPDIVGQPPLLGPGKVGGLSCGGRLIGVTTTGILAPHKTARTVAITSPSPYQVVPRAGSSTTMQVTGTFTGPAGAVEVRWGSGEWTRVTSDRELGTWECSLTGCAAGQATLSARIIDADDTEVSHAYVGIGAVLGLGGQSNASGRGYVNQTYSHATLKPGLYGNDEEWKELVDPCDSGSGQVDPVTFDYDAGGMGSVWPLVATQFMAAKGYPIAFVPMCKGGAGISRFVPGADRTDRSTIFGSMLTRIRAAGVQLVFFWQGEGGIQDVTGQSWAIPYQQMTSALAEEVPGLRVMPVKLQHCTSVVDADQNNHRVGIDYVWANDINTVTGPTMASTSPAGVGDLSTDDGFHLQSDANLLAAATRINARLITLL